MCVARQRCIGGVGSCNSAIQKFLVDDGRYVIPAVKSIAAFIFNTQLQPLRVLVGSLSREIERFQSDACGAFELDAPLRFEFRFLPLYRR